MARSNLEPAPPGPAADRAVDADGNLVTRVYWRDPAIAAQQSLLQPDHAASRLSLPKQQGEVWFLGCPYFFFSHQVAFLHNLERQLQPVYPGCLLVSDVTGAPLPCPPFFRTREERRASAVT